jgi:hypothetical protein
LFSDEKFHLEKRTGVQQNYSYSIVMLSPDFARSQTIGKNIGRRIY